MEIVKFLIPMSQISEMKEDGDKISLSLSYTCIISITCAVLLGLLHSLYGHISWPTRACLVFSFIAVISWCTLYWSRPRFVLHNPSLLEILFDPTNPARRFWSLESIPNPNNFEQHIPFNEYRVEIRNRSRTKTITNITVITEHIGPMPIRPALKQSDLTKQNIFTLDPGCSVLVPILRWPVYKFAGMLAGDTALAYGPIRISASGENVKVVERVFNFDWQREPMIFD